jgi:Coenzyme PQQ synthesis protein D (PqqD)
MSFVIPSSVLVSELEGETVLLNLETGTYFSLNRFGAEVWALLQQGQQLDGIAALATSRYDVNDEWVRVDVESLLASLVANGLLEQNDEDK